MVDKAVFIGMGGAKNAMTELEILTNNLANINTTGFRGDFEVLKQSDIGRSNIKSRTLASVGGTSTDFTKGPKLTTGRDLDIAINNNGFIAVQSKTGREAYTRAGDLQLSMEGYLTTRNGELVLGSKGAINIPPVEVFSIGPDGTISGRLPGTKDMVNFNKIKFTNPEIKDLYKGKDGLFYMVGDNATAPEDLSVTITNGVLEGSNVNAVDTLTKLIDLSRHYEMQSNMMKTLDDNASKANQILSLPT
jgi:flagellar basal-body rod protein FlgF